MTRQMDHTEGADTVPFFEDPACFGELGRKPFQECKPADPRQVPPMADDGLAPQIIPVQSVYCYGEGDPFFFVMADQFRNGKDMVKMAMGAENLLGNYLEGLNLCYNCSSIGTWVYDYTDSAIAGGVNFVSFYDIAISRDGTHHEGMNFIVFHGGIVP